MRQVGYGCLALPGSCGSSVLLVKSARCQQNTLLSNASRGCKSLQLIHSTMRTSYSLELKSLRFCCSCCKKDSTQEDGQFGQSDISIKNKSEVEEDSLGVIVALGLLDFYKREISPLLPKSCRFVPSCSEYSMQAYKKYGVMKGTILTAWRLLRCNPFGSYGYDPPRWFGERN